MKTKVTRGEAPQHRPDFSEMWDPSHGYNRPLIMHYAANYVRGTRAERTAKAWDYAKRRREAKMQLRDNDQTWLRVARMEKELAACYQAMSSIDKILHSVVTKHEREDS